RDASGEIWLFKQKTQADNAGRYESPKGLFAKLTRADTGWRLLDQKWRVATFDELGRITSETDEFYKADTQAATEAGIDNGNIIRYLYDESGRLARIVDPVHRATTFEYWEDSESQEPGAYPGLLKEVKDWRERTVEYLYDRNGQLETVKMPEVKAAEGVPQTYEFTDTKRPRVKYTYKTAVAPSAGASPDQGFNDYIELQNLATITDPAEAGTGGDARVTFSYDESADPLHHDREKRQIWARGEFATFTYNGPTSVESIDAFGQKRIYTLTDKDKHDKRIHVEKKTLDAVPVVEFPGGLPPKADLNVTAGGKNLETTYELDDEGLYEVEHYPNGLTVTNTWGQIVNSGPGKVLLSTLYAGTHIGQEQSAFGYDKDTAAGNLLTITKSNATGSTQRDAQVPSRERLTVESKDEGVGRKAEYNTNGLLKSDSTTNAGGTVTLEHSLTYYSADATLLITRGQVFSESKGDDTLRQNYVYSNGPLGGYRLHTSDVIRGTTTDTDYDAYDRVVHVVIRDGTAGTVLADEATGYDASGRVAYVSRKQKDAGNVVTTITYDEIGRETKRSMTGAAVNGSPSTISTTARYDIPALKITRTDPAVGTEGGTELTELDHLGRPVKRTHIAGSSLTELYGYDSGSAPTYASDGTRIAVLTQRDELHREIARVGTDGISSKKSYEAWGRLFESSGSDSGGNVIAHSGRNYSKNGRLRLVNEQIDDSGRSRQTRFGWDDGDLTLTTRVGETTGVLTAAFPTGKVRAQQTTQDAAGRVKETLVGEATGTDGAIDAASAFSRTTYGYQGFAPNVITQYEPLAAGVSSVTIAMFDGLARPLELAQSGGSSSTKNQYDEAGNVVSHTAPGMKEEKATYDSRGLMTSRTLSDGRTQELQYDESGALSSRKDESGETTTYTNDDLGRLTKVQYADGTTEEKQYESGSGFLSATKDRAGRWISREYDDKGRLIALHDGQAAGGPPLMTYEYDAGGRLNAVRNADGALEFAEFDFLGRPKVTRSIRYANHSGLSARTIADVHSQRHSWSIFDDERSAYRMPDAGATPQGFDSLSSPWMQTIAEERDAGSNVVRQTENSDPISEAVGRGIGRVQLRRQFVGSKSLDTSYGFADGGTTASGVQLPAGATANLQSFLLRWTQSKIGNTVVGGSANNRDSADRVSQTRDQGLGGRVSEFQYDDRGRLNTSWLNVPGPVAATLGQSDSFVDADFRSARVEPPQLSLADRMKLGTAAAEIEPPSWTATRAATQQIGSRTILLGDSSSVTRNYAFAGGRRTNDGKWTSSFDAFGQLSSISSTDAGRRVDYLWDPAGRLIGRTAFRLDGTNSWVPEDRGEAIAHDGIPADTTFVWDPVSDRLLAIYEAGKSVAGTGGTTAGLVRQYLHVDLGYDDPVRVVMPGANGNVTYLPIVDQAGGGSLQAVVDSTGTMVERVLYADSYGDAPRYLQGPIVDRISFAAKKDGNGELQSVDVKVHFTEAIDASTVAGGVRLAAVDAAKTVVYETGVSAATDDKYSVHWSLTKTEWEHFTTAVSGASLEIAIGNTLRASAWGDATVTAAPHWTRTIYGTDSTSQFPVITRQSLASVAAFISGVPANEEKSTDFYSIGSLYLAGTEESKAKLLFDFHALPFHDPATNLIYARARWYDPATGTFLTPDRLGFIDSSNLYAFGAGDPVNHRDPSGDCAGVDSVNCGDYAREVNDQFNNPMNWVGNSLRSGRFAAFEVKGFVMAAPRAAAGLWDILKDPVGARMKMSEGIVNLAVAVAMDPGEVASNAVNSAINANPDDVAEVVGDTLFWAAVGEGGKIIQAAREAKAAARAAQRTRVLAAIAESRASRASSQFLKYAKADRVFQELLPLVETGDFSTPYSRALFYSGEGAKEALEAFRKLHPGFVTLDETTAGTILNAAKVYDRLPFGMADSLWRTASRRYAEAASGRVHLFDRFANSWRILREEEEPVLFGNRKVWEMIYHRDYSR
ncbi:MAG TPA: RHS repeat-associated core domain-containing protein, partial [Vicinamibacterales bacterium]|nr:RHS repeat-associated core domain-containing protein [Vicinamibacterales bacterium]